MNSKDYHIRIDDDPAAVDASQWNALLARQARPTPFMRHEYLLALHSSGSAAAHTGWTPRWLSMWAGKELRAAAPAYLKAHSYGEYVFDWSWAEAHQRNGLPYYPKLLVAVPFTPVPGSRLLASDADARLALLRALQSLAEQNGLSSAHLLFHDEADARAARALGWMARASVQFHWEQRSEPPYGNFADLLAELKHDKRKKIMQERRKVASAGVEFSTHLGSEIDSGLWDFFYRCYVHTYRAHHSTPYLQRDFFERMTAQMPGNWLMFLARRDGEPIAASLVALDPQRRHAYGRYWGCTEPVDCLHFEACYYQPLAWCIANGYQRFEGGAQGEHKMARGLMPVATASAHWLAHPAFSRAVGDFLTREGRGIAAYVDELAEHAPFKAGASLELKA